MLNFQEFLNCLTNYIRSASKEPVYYMHIINGHYIYNNRANLIISDERNGTRDIKITKITRSFPSEVSHSTTYQKTVPVSDIPQSWYATYLKLKFLEAMECNEQLSVQEWFSRAMER